MDNDEEFSSLRIASVEREANDTVSLVLDIPDDLASQFAYRAGQFITLLVEIGGKRLRRCYSMSTAPETDAFTRITVKHVSGGQVSGWINQAVKPGDTIAVKPPEGRFCLRDNQDSQRELLLLGGGSGITPLISLAKSALASTSRPVMLIYANRDRESVIFGRDLEILEKTYPDRFSVIHWLDSERGLITVEQLAKLLTPSAETDCYICGPEAFMQVAEAAACLANVAPDHVFVERFNSLPGEDGAFEAAVSEAEACETIKITCRKQRCEGPYHEGDTILEAACRLGLRPAFSCLAGTCASCMAKVIEGSVVMKANSALTDAEVDEGYILSCQAYPTSKFANIAFED